MECNTSSQRFKWTPMEKENKKLLNGIYNGRPLAEIKIFEYYKKIANILSKKLKIPSLEQGIWSRLETT